MIVPRSRWLPTLTGALLLCGGIGWYAWRWTTSGTSASLLVPVTHGAFQVLVTSSGELQSSQFAQINGPADAQNVGVYQSSISSIVPEGTVVKAGDVVAELDRTPVQTQLNTLTLNLQKAQADFTAAQLDSALALAQAREDIRTAEFTLEQKKLLKEEAEYEAPAIKRQAELDFEQADRTLAQAHKNLTIKTKQAVAKMVTTEADLKHQQNDFNATQAVLNDFTIRAPAAGMVIYNRNNQGKEKGVGSRWDAWDRSVAALPDLTQMESDSYINEVDIRKIAIGQPVQITLDADPGKQLRGIVTQVANVGEQRPNQDSKVFRVHIKVTTPDTTLRPGMTTANAIQVAAFPNVLSVPLEAVVGIRGYSYVYKRTGSAVVKQMIDAGPTNDQAIVVRRGLTPADHVLLTPPADTVGIRTVIIPGLKPATP